MEAAVPAPRRGRVDDPPERAVLVYDGDCGFCQARVDAWRPRTGEALDYLPARALGERFAAIPRELLGLGVVRVGSDGTWTFGGEAVLLVLADAGRRWPHALYRTLPGFAPLVELLYRAVARHRHRIARRSGSRCRVDGGR